MVTSSTQHTGPGLVFSDVITPAIKIGTVATHRDLSEDETTYSRLPFTNSVYQAWYVTETGLTLTVNTPETIYCIDLNQRVMSATIEYRSDRLVYMTNFA